MRTIPGRTCRLHASMSMHTEAKYRVEIESDVIWSHPNSRRRTDCRFMTKVQLILLLEATH